MGGSLGIMGGSLVRCDSNFLQLKEQDAISSLAVHKEYYIFQKDDAKLLLKHSTRQVPQIWTNQSDKSDWGGIEIIRGRIKQHNYVKFCFHIETAFLFENAH